jgi:hypothetical protein
MERESDREKGRVREGEGKKARERLGWREKGRERKGEREKGRLIISKYYCLIFFQFSNKNIRIFFSIIY